MLVRVHVDLGSDAVLSPVARLQQADLRQARLCLLPGLEEHGRVHCHPVHPGSRAQSNLPPSQLRVHLHDARPPPLWCPHPRQGVRHCAGREPVQPQPRDVLCAGVVVLDLLGAASLRLHVRVRVGRDGGGPDDTLCRGLVRCLELVLEVPHTDRVVTALPDRPAHLLSDAVLQDKGLSGTGRRCV